MQFLHKNHKFSLLNRLFPSFGHVNSKFFSRNYSINLFQMANGRLILNFINTQTKLFHFKMVWNILYFLFFTTHRSNRWSCWSLLLTSTSRLNGLDWLQRCSRRSWWDASPRASFAWDWAGFWTTSVRHASSWRCLDFTVFRLLFRSFSKFVLLVHGRYAALGFRFLLHFSNYILTLFYYKINIL